MNKKTLFNLVQISLILLITSCTLNFFSVFSPRDAANVYDVETALNLANSSLLRGDYSNALAAYERVLEINPTNSVALLGAANSYVLNDQELKLKDLANSMLPNDLKLKLKLKTIKLMADSLQDGGPSEMLKSIGSKKNALYRISRYTVKKLSTIVDGKSDNIISSNDINVNLNFAIFNLINSLFILLDNNNDGVNDTNDWIYIDDNFQPHPILIEKVSNNVLNISGNISQITNLSFKKEDLLLGFILNPNDNPLRNTLLFVKTNLNDLSNIVENDILKVINTIPEIVTNVGNGFIKSINSLNRIEQKIKSKDAKEIIKNLSENLTNGIAKGLDNMDESLKIIKTNFSNFTKTINNLIVSFENPAKFDKSLTNIFGKNFIEEFYSTTAISNSIYVKDTNYGLMDLITNTKLSFSNTFGIDISKAHIQISNLFIEANLTNINEISEKSLKFGVTINNIADLTTYITNRFVDIGSEYNNISNSLSKVIK